MNTALATIDARAGGPSRHWSAELDLVFAKSGHRTRFRHLRHEGPLRVQRLFHPEAHGRAHCYLLHPPGGVVLGDEITIRGRIDSGDALITTPSAGRFYSVADHPHSQRQNVRLSVADGSLAWLPQETLLFPGARAVLSTQISLQETSTLSYWDVIVLGKPASGEHFDSGALTQKLEIERNGRPLLCERLALQAGDRSCRGRIALAGRSTFGTAVFTHPASAAIVDSWIEVVESSVEAGCFSLTQRGELLVARYLGDKAARARQGFSMLWAALEEAQSGRRPAEPRIWHT